VEAQEAVEKVVAKAATVEAVVKQLNAARVLVKLEGQRRAAENRRKIDHHLHQFRLESLIKEGVISIEHCVGWPKIGRTRHQIYYGNFFIYGAFRYF
jgi:hypothetical protein